MAIIRLRKGRNLHKLLKGVRRRVHRKEAVMMRRHIWRVVLVFGLALMFPSGVMAQQFPTKDITLVVPWAAGGGTDTIARTLVKNAKKHFGVNVNVVNKTGGLGAIGMGSVATAPADGYTVGVITFHLSNYRMMGSGSPFL